VADVPTVFFATGGGTPDDARYHRGPAAVGYGRCPKTSSDQPLQVNKLFEMCIEDQCLNLNTTEPDSRTIFNLQLAWLPQVIIANRGTGLENVLSSELRYLWLTGRRSNGENLVAGQRDITSGSRNAVMNALCADPSWAVGDNLGLENTSSALSVLGPRFQPTNHASSSRLRDVVKNHRLAVGWFGLDVENSAARGAKNGEYEILNVMFDVRGGTQYVRPSLDGIIYNCDIDSGWPIGANHTFATIGDPLEENPDSPAFMQNQNAADYIRNLYASIIEAQRDPGGQDSTFMPGKYLSRSFILTAAVSCRPKLGDLCTLEENAELNTELQEYTRENMDIGLGAGVDIPAYGSTNVANLVPVRAATNIIWSTRPEKNECDCAYPADGRYSDGSTNGAYLNRFTGAYGIIGGTTLNARNQLAGDFNADGSRDLNDVPQMVAAVFDPAGWVTNSGFGGTSDNPAVPEIIGDFNGDGNFDCRDIRYFCDGLAIDPDSGKLNRAAAFKLVDETWEALTGDGNYFNTTLRGCDDQELPYVAGASAADIIGNTPWKGASPHGYDCEVNCSDIAYIMANYGDWTSLDDAVNIDLSADMNGDLLINGRDVDAARGWLGGCWCPGLVRADLNCDNQVDFEDIDPFVTALVSREEYERQYPDCEYLNADANGDGSVDFDDIDGFVTCVINNGCP
jgi:hypothetical protein